MKHFLLAPLLIALAGCSNGDLVSVNYFSSDYMYQKSSLRRAKIRNKYGRYISFLGKTSNAYAATEGRTIEGTPSSFECQDNSYFNFWNNYGSYSGNSKCEYKEGVAPKYIPGKRAGIQNKWFKYLLDCKDLTFDRKGDFVNADGGIKKGWMKIIDDPVAIAVAGRYCQKINTLPLE